MQLAQHIVDFINAASAKALATNGPAGLNVVPVSVIKAEVDQIFLYNFFMNKTAANIPLPNTPVALTCWEGLRGVQLRATATIDTQSEQYATEQTAMLQQFPNRTLASLIVLRPTEVFDVSVGEEKVV